MIVCIALMSILALLWFFGSMNVAALNTSRVPQEDGKAITERACVGCHTLKVVTSKRATPQQWSTLVDQMLSRGADVDDDEVETLVNYLSKNFPPVQKTTQTPATHGQARLVNVNKATATQLATGLDLSTKDADAIVAYRKRNGDFRTVADLIKVPGIDAKKIESSKNRVAF